MGSSGRQPFSDFGAKSHAMTAGLPTQLTPVHILGTSCAQRRPNVCMPCGRACELPDHPDLSQGTGLHERCPPSVDTK